MAFLTLLKTLHILSASILFGTGLGIAFFCYRGLKDAETPVRYFATRTTVLADYVFTLPAVIIQPVTGIWMAKLANYELSELWLSISIALYSVASITWFATLFVRRNLRNMAKEALQTGQQPPAAFTRTMRLWTMLSMAALIDLIIIYFVMVVQPE